MAQEKDDKGHIHTDYTMLTVARDPQNLRYYWRTYNDQSTKMVDLKKVDLQGKRSRRSTPRDNSGLRIGPAPSINQNRNSKW